MIDPNITRPQPGALTFCAISVLVALRSGPRTAQQLHNAIGDRAERGGGASTQVLLLELRQMELVSHAHTTDDRWYLMPGGVTVLETNGLSVAEEARY